MDNINRINNIRLNSRQIISAITEYIIVSCLDLKNINSILNDFEGILIKIVDPVVNKHDANFSNCIEYEQVPYTKINDYENAKMEKIKSEN